MPLNTSLQHLDRAVVVFLLVLGAVFCVHAAAQTAPEAPITQPPTPSGTVPALQAPATTPVRPKDPLAATALTAVPVSITPENMHAAIPLWPDGAPGALGKAEGDTPAVFVYLPAANPTHTLIVVVPGGGYEHLAIDHEGLQVAQWLNAHGIAAVVLRYRLGPAYHYPAQLQDAQRAIRYARAHAPNWGVAPDHIGMWGFSAGGHLTATTGTKFDTASYPATGSEDALSSRPDFLILAYPVISMEDNVGHTGSQRNLLGPNTSEQQKQFLSADQHVTAQTPATFLFSTTDDQVVPVENTVLFYNALVKNKVQAEMHIYRHGAHGKGLAQADPELSGWPEVLYSWLHENGWAQ